MRKLSLILERMCWIPVFSNWRIRLAQPEEEKEEKEETFEF